jgi:hypothetical protein
MNTQVSFRRPHSAAGPLAWAWLLVLLLSLGLAARAQDIPPVPRPARLVNDLAALCSPRKWTRWSKSW